MLSLDPRRTCMASQELVLDTELDIGEVIAIRKLTLRRSTGDLEVCVSLGKPSAGKRADEFYCFYCLDVSGRKKVSHGCGVDGFQALQLAMQRIGIDLSILKRNESGEFVWPVGEPGQTGFPFPPGF